MVVRMKNKSLLFKKVTLHNSILSKFIPMHLKSENLIKKNVDTAHHLQHFLGKHPFLFT